MCNARGTTRDIDHDDASCECRHECYVTKSGDCAAGNRCARRAIGRTATQLYIERRVHQAALVAQAHIQLSAKNFMMAASTMVNAHCVSRPNNPLVWLEYAQVRMNEQNYSQAESLWRARRADAFGQWRFACTKQCMAHDCWQLACTGQEQ